MNHPEASDAKIIVGGNNFVGGSSREAAVHALDDYGIGCRSTVDRRHLCAKLGQEQQLPTFAADDTQSQWKDHDPLRFSNAGTLKRRCCAATRLVVSKRPLNQSWRFRQCNGRS
jgi:hypothetical protein